MWYVLQVSTGKEMAVTSTLSNNRVLAYTPRENRLIRKGGGWSQKEYILFPGYVFLNLDYTAENYYMVKAIPGVLRFLGPDGLHLLVGLSRQPANFSLGVLGDLGSDFFDSFHSSLPPQALMLIIISMEASRDRMA